MPRQTKKQRRDAASAETRAERNTLEAADPLYSHFDALQAAIAQQAAPKKNKHCRGATQQGAFKRIFNVTPTTTKTRGRPSGSKNKKTIAAQGRASVSAGGANKKQKKARGIFGTPPLDPEEKSRRVLFPSAAN